LSLNITNQYIAQLTEKIRDAVIGNAGTMIAYRIGASDAEFMAKEFPGVTIDDLVNLKKQNFKQIDIADISAVGKEIWLPKMEEADVLFFEGGNSYYLMEWMNKSGLTKILPELLKTKVYVGLSAGSMVTGKDLALI